MKNHFLSDVDTNNIYRTILDLEGPKHPRYNWEELEYAAKYIEEKLQSYGIYTEIQEFYIEGFEKPFKNVIGYIGDREKPAIVLGSHYDTVPFSPGANDNLSGVAVSLELARILNMQPNPPSIIIAAFTLEEGHPSKNKWILDELQEKGLLDSQDRIISYNIVRFNKKLGKLFSDLKKTTKQSRLQIFETILEEYAHDFTEAELDFTKAHYNSERKNQQINDYKKYNVYGNLNALVGSTQFVEKLKREKKEINYIINFDTLGWINEKKQTQKPLPIPKEMRSLITAHKVNIEDTVGNFIVVIANKDSKIILDKYVGICSQEKVDIKHLGIYLPFEFDDIRQSLPDTLRSDHAPFWKVGIPGVFITDTGNFRSPYYHTAEDKHYRVDFSMLEKIVNATIKLLSM